MSKFVLTKLLNNVQKDLAFSQPVSNKMLKLLLRLLKQNPELRERIWIVDRDLEQKQILWWSAAKIARERNLDLKTMLKSCKILFQNHQPVLLIDYLLAD